jgi:hypothetical protein
MIARHEATGPNADIWARLAAPLPTGVISWRQDGRPIQRDGRYLARFVAYIEANTVRERLDQTVPSEWDLTLELLPALPGNENEDAVCSFKARLQVLGVIREDVGTGKDYKQAATDAFKRAAVRFGIGHELYAFEQNWVRVDGDGKYAKALEDPAEAYARRQGSSVAVSQTTSPASDEPTYTDDDAPFDEAPAEQATATASGPRATDEPSCPKCGGRMWDNRISKKNPKAPDFKCRSRACDGVVWPARVQA